jgi:hypothetical protein
MAVHQIRIAVRQAEVKVFADGKELARLQMSAESRPSAQPGQPTTQVILELVKSSYLISRLRLEPISGRRK